VVIDLDDAVAFEGLMWCKFGHVTLEIADLDDVVAFERGGLALERLDQRVFLDQLELREGARVCVSV